MCKEALAKLTIGSYIASKIFFVIPCIILSSTLLIPSCLVATGFPSFEMSTCLTAPGRYAMRFILSTRSAMFSWRFSPYASFVTLSIPTAFLPSNSWKHCSSDSWSPQ